MASDYAAIHYGGITVQIMRCLVSGATGFIGRELCARLAAAGEEFSCLGRDRGNVPGARDSLLVDLGEDTPDSEDLQGINVVFHLAGIAHQRAEPDMYERVNYRGTLDLAAAAAAAGVSTFIFLSSVKAMGPSDAVLPRSELDCEPANDPYGDSKRRAETALLDRYAGSSMAVIILRPALVYGPGAAGNLQLLARAVRAGLPRPPCMGGRSMVSRQDLVDLLMLLAAAPPRGVHTWIVTDRQLYTAREIHDVFRRAIGREPARGWLPVWAWRGACAVMDLLSGAARGATYNKIFATERYDSGALEAATGWRARLTLRDEAAAMMAYGGDR